MYGQPAQSRRPVSTISRNPPAEVYESGIEYGESDGECYWDGGYEQEREVRAPMQKWKDMGYARVSRCLHSLGKMLTCSSRMWTIYQQDPVLTEIFVHRPLIGEEHRHHRAQLRSRRANDDMKLRKGKVGTLKQEVNLQPRGPTDCWTLKLISSERCAAQYAPHHAVRGGSSAHEAIPTRRDGKRYEKRYRQSSYRPRDDYGSGEPFQVDEENDRDFRDYSYSPASQNDQPGTHGEYEQASVYDQPASFCRHGSP